MLRTLTSSCVGLALVVLAVPALIGQQPKETSAAPIPAQIAAARKLFIANGGTDVASQNIFKRAGQPDQAYNHFYAAIQSWGRYELVSNPADADLVFEIRFAAPMYVGEKITTYEPQFGLNIVDAKTHFLLWNLSEPVEGAFRKATWLKNFDQGLDLLMSDIKRLAGAPTTTSEPSKQ